jgi:hypothetical protein
LLPFLRVARQHGATRARVRQAKSGRRRLTLVFPTENHAWAFSMSDACDPFDLATPAAALRMRHNVVAVGLWHDHV